MLISEYRASRIIYNFLVSNGIKGPFILPANVCGIIPLTFHYAGVTFDFFDIQNDNLCIDQNKVLENLSEYAGLLFVRTYGVEESFDIFFENIKKKKSDFIIIDDCCLAMPDLTPSKNEHIDLKVYSLGYAKQVNMGTGAFAFLLEKWSYRHIQLSAYNDTDFETYEHELKRSIQSNTLLEKKEYHFLENISYKFNTRLVEEKKAAVKLHKATLNDIYSSKLPLTVQFETKFQGWRFNIKMNNEQEKNELLNLLFARKLFASSHYFPISINWNAQIATNSLSLHQKVINLFNDFYYTEQQAFETCEVINNYLLKT